MEGFIHFKMSQWLLLLIKKGVTLLLVIIFAIQFIDKEINLD
jgi:hypothetical protein